MTGEKGADDAVTVDPGPQGPTEGRVIQGRSAHITADILKNSGICILIADVACDADGGHAGEVGGNELYVPGGETVEHGFLVRSLYQKNAVSGLLVPLPPGLVRHQTGAGLRLGQEIGAGADGRGFRTGLDDGNVQQGGQAAVGGAQRHGDGAVTGCDSGDAGQTGTVALGSPGPVQHRPDVGGGEGRAVGKGDTASERKDVGGKILIGGIVGAQPELGFEIRPQTEQPLAEKGGDHLLHPVRTGHRIQGLVRGIGQG